MSLLAPRSDRTSTLGARIAIENVVAMFQTPANEREF